VFDFRWAVYWTDRTWTCLCSVTDLAMPLLNVMASDKLNTYVQNVNARVVQDVLGTTTYPTKNAKGKGREELEDPETAVLRKAFEHTQLNIWPYVSLFPYSILCG